MLWKSAFLPGTAPQGHFVASLGRARSLRSLAKPLSRWWDANSPPQSTTFMLSELEFGDILSFGAPLQTQYRLLGGILLIVGKGFEAFRLRQGRPAVGRLAR